jgi:hypothetical protein
MSKAAEAADSENSIEKTGICGNGKPKFRKE